MLLSESDPHDGRRLEIGGLIADACRLAEAHADAGGARKRLVELAQRLEADRFQLAVVGQFKRGKSTLMNAIVGRPLLPAAAIPATSVATIVSSGDRRAVTVTFGSGAAETVNFDSDDALATRLAGLVTEDGNPRNALDVDRVHAFVPWPILSGQAVLVDTPGIGSTHLHNTAAARSALNECDAALLVFSADLPITETEEAYTREVQVATPRIVVVMNKVDLATEEDRLALERLLRSCLQRVVPADRDVPIWPVSARAALSAKAAGDPVALERSGLPALERHLTDVLIRERQTLLDDAVSSKAAGIVAALKSQLDLRRAALVLPIEELERRAILFAQVAAAAEKEGRVCLDLLQTDGARIRGRLDSECDALYERARGALRADLLQRIDASATLHSARAEVTKAIEAFFEAARARLVAQVRSEIANCVMDHVGRVDAIVDLVGRSAAEIMGVGVRSAEEDASLPDLREVYWVGSGLPDTLDSLTRDALVRLLPRAFREARLRRAMWRGVESALVRNVSSLQWALQQMIDDAFRRTGPKLAVGFRVLNRSVEEALQSARNGHRLREAEHDAHLNQLACDSERLAEIATALSGLHAGRPSRPDHAHARLATGGAVADLTGFVISRAT